MDTTPQHIFFQVPTVGEGRGDSVQMSEVPSDPDPIEEKWEYTCTQWVDRKRAECGSTKYERVS